MSINQNHMIILRNMTSSYYNIALIMNRLSNINNLKKTAPYAEIVIVAEDEGYNVELSISHYAGESGKTTLFKNGKKLAEIEVPEKVIKMLTAGYHNGALYFSGNGIKLARDKVNAYKLAPESEEETSNTDETCKNIRKLHALVGMYRKYIKSDGHDRDLLLDLAMEERNGYNLLIYPKIASKYTTEAVLLYKGEYQVACDINNRTLCVIQYGVNNDIVDVNQKNTISISNKIRVSTK